MSLVMSFIVKYIDDCDDSFVTEHLEKARASYEEFVNIHHDRILA